MKYVEVLNMIKQAADVFSPEMKARVPEPPTIAARKKRQQLAFENAQEVTGSAAQRRGYYQQKRPQAYQEELAYNTAKNKYYGNGQKTGPTPEDYERKRQEYMARHGIQGNGGKAVVKQVSGPAGGYSATQGGVLVNNGTPNANRRAQLARQVALDRGYRNLVADMGFGAQPQPVPSGRAVARR